VTGGRTGRRWTARYALDRLADRRFRARRPDAPWLTPAAVSFLEDWLRPGDVGIEWGSGRSTRWLGRRVGRLLSLEHDPDWGARVAAWIAAEPPLAAVVDHRVVSKSGGAGSEYCRAAEEVADGGADFCLVDGKLRAEAGLVAVRKLRPGGLLVFDNADRYVPRARPSRTPGARSESEGWPSPAFEAFGSAVADWRCVWTTNGLFDTAFWIRPA